MILLIRMNCQDHDWCDLLLSTHHVFISGLGFLLILPLLLSHLDLLSFLTFLRVIEVNPLLFKLG